MPAATEEGFTAAPAPDSDVALVARMAAGDEGALAALYDRWSGRLYAVALHILGSPDRAEDVLEDTLWQAWRGAGSYSPTRKSVATWLLTMARRKALERLRARGRTSSVESEVTYGAPDPMFDEPERPAPGTEHAADFEHAIRQLPDAQRIPFELAFFRGMLVGEISKQLDQPGGAVATNLQLAVQRVRSQAGPLLGLERSRG